MDWTSDSGGSDDDLENFSWDGSEPAAEQDTAGTSCGLGAAAGPSGEAGPSRPSLFTHFVGMGFPEEMVERAIRDNGEGNTEAILETLLTYNAIEKSPSEHEESPVLSSSASDGPDDDISDVDFRAEIGETRQASPSPEVEKEEPDKLHILENHKQQAPRPVIQGESKEEDSSKPKANVPSKLKALQKIDAPRCNLQQIHRIRSSKV